MGSWTDEIEIMERDDDGEAKSSCNLHQIWRLIHELAEMDQFDVNAHQEVRHCLTPRRMDHVSESDGRIDRDTLEDSSVGIAQLQPVRRATQHEHLYVVGYCPAEVATRVLGTTTEIVDDREHSSAWLRTHQRITDLYACGSHRLGTDELVEPALIPGMLLRQRASTFRSESLSFRAEARASDMLHVYVERHQMRPPCC